MRTVEKSFRTSASGYLSKWFRKGMWRPRFFSILFTAICGFYLLAGLQAHPSFGLVVTDANEIYFSDVLHNGGTLWKLDSERSLSIVLTDEHSHFLFSDNEGNIWGTNHEYLPSTQSNRNSLWKLNVDGTKEMIIAPTTHIEEFTGSNFVIDSKGNLYYDYDNTIYIRHPDDSYELYSPFLFNRIVSLQIDDDGNIYVVDNNIDRGSIFKISPNKKVAQIVINLLETSPGNPPFPKKRFNMLYALHIDTNNDLYIANSGSRRVTKVNADHTVEHIYKSMPPWYPVAYYLHDDIEFVMETGFSLPGGNLGPRIIEVRNGESKIIANADHPEKRIDELNNQTITGLALGRILGSTKYVLFGGPIVALAVIFLVLFRRRRRIYDSPSQMINI